MCERYMETCFSNNVADIKVTWKPGLTNVLLPVFSSVLVVSFTATVINAILSCFSLQKRHSRKVCDSKFLKDMMSICKRRAKSIIGKLTFKGCVKYAVIYYGAVRVGGKKHYG